MKTALPDRHKSLIQWVSQATGIGALGVKVRLRGNDLHILCESLECPQRWRTLSDLLQALQQTDLDNLTSHEQPAIYQILVYGRKKGEQRPRWCHRVYLNQLDRHLEQVNQALLADEEKSRKGGGALIISNESLARQGHPEAIARYLSETLSTLGIAVQVKVKTQKSTTKHQNPQSRLWIFCQSSYSPDPSLIAEPVAQKLRHLKLSGYQDAVISAQVSGETTADWLLRIDLTPPEVMLKAWARWGDVQAITRLLNQALADFQVAVGVTLKESTLHIFCTPASDPLTITSAPDKALCVEAVVHQLEIIAPQGILSATMYGQKTREEKPAWVDWFSLPANEHQALSISTFDLARHGDEEAIHFLLERLLNSDLDLRLTTGGTRVLLLRKGDLLHVMCDAPVSPGRKNVAPRVAQFVHQLKIPGIAGVRVYGRRAGHKEPFWHYGIDFEQRQRLVPEATPEFAATCAHVQELLPSQTNEPIFRSELKPEEIPIFVVGVAQDWWTTLKKFLIRTQLFTENEQSLETTVDSYGFWVALVWGAIGLLLTVQADWILGRIVARATRPIANVATVSPQPSQNQQQGKETVFFTSTSGEKSTASQSSTFNASKFTRPQDTATATAILLAARSGIPTFNARQLDEQLALYKHRIAENGHPPDVLIVGSSRALRGIDPVAISQALATQGYPNLDVFNFGINGATAQVVDFLIRRVLKPSELPKLILWADGSRAFNSGREDVTFNAIATSPGYKQSMQNALSDHSVEGELGNSNQKSEVRQGNNSYDHSSYQVLDEWLSQGLANFSATYSQRQQLKNWLNQTINSLLVTSQISLHKAQQHQQVNSVEEIIKQAVNFHGFLPVSVRFQPHKYYQKHPHVPGNYDNDYKSFHLQGEQDVATQALLEFTQAQNINLVFINMPLTAEYLDPVRSKYEQEFQQHMLQLAGHPNFIYRDLSQLWTQSHDLFSDPSHLNRYGAYRVSKRLANDPLIPWPTQKRNEP